MITILHIVADLLLFIIIVIYDKRISELEQANEELTQRVCRLSRRIGRANV